MKIFKNVDEKFEELGFKKKKENGFGVEYYRYNNEYDFNQRLDICYKSNGYFLIFSYDETNTTSDYSPVVGLSELELKLVLKK